MKNLVRKGLTFLAPGPLTSGGPCQVASLVGVASTTVLTGDTTVAERTGVYALSVTATTAALVPGGVIYIHTDNSLDNVATDGVVFGYSDSINAELAIDATEIINVVLG